MVTSAADLGDLLMWPPMEATKIIYIYPYIIYVPFWKRQTKDIAMVTSAADLGDLQTKPNNAY